MKKKIFLSIVVFYLLIGFSFYFVSSLPFSEYRICEEPFDQPELRKCETYPQLDNEIMSALVWMFFWLPGIIGGYLQDYLRDFI